MGTFQAKESDIKEFSHGAFEMAKKVKVFASKTDYPRSPEPT